MYTLDDVPDAVKRLPRHAQEIWVNAWNNAFKQYQSEELAFATAWAAVEKAGYMKDEQGNWRRVSREASIDAFYDATPEKGVIRNVTLIKAGVSKNNRYFPPDVLARDYGVFEDALCYFGHQVGWDVSDPTKLCGVIKNVYYDAERQAIRGDLIYDENAEAQLAKAAKFKDRIGLSIATPLEVEPYVLEGAKVWKVNKFEKTPLTSVDVVVNPGAAGRLFEAVNDEVPEPQAQQQEEQQPEVKEPDVNTRPIVEEPAVATEAREAVVSPTGNTVDANSIAQRVLRELQAKFAYEAEARSLIDSANLPATAAEHLRSKYLGLESIGDINALKRDIDVFKQLASAAAQPASGERISVGMEPKDKLQMALEAMFGVAPDNTQGIKPFSGLREAYIAYTGDYDLRWTVGRQYEGLSSVDLPLALQDAMHKRLVQDYNEADWGWRKFCTVGTVNDFRVHHDIRVGYFEDLSDVDPEREDYPELQPYTDEEVTYQAIQKGNQFRITRKFIINDDLNTVLKIIGRLGRSAARTLAKRIYVSRLAANSVLTDGNNLPFFHNRPGVVNIGSSALTPEAVQATITAMQSFTEPSSGEPLGMVARPGDLVLIVPNALQWKAQVINNPDLGIIASSGVVRALQGWFGSDGGNIIVCPLLDSVDTNDWYLAWTPDNLEWIRVVFLRGQEEPELFLADNPLVGEMFDADKLVYKVRHEYEVYFIDPRGCYKHVVT